MWSDIMLPSELHRHSEWNTLPPRGVIFTGKKIKNSGRKKRKRFEEGSAVRWLFYGNWSRFAQLQRTLPGCVPILHRGFRYAEYESWAPLFWHELQLCWLHSSLIVDEGNLMGNIHYCVHTTKIIELNNILLRWKHAIDRALNVRSSSSVHAIILGLFVHLFLPSASAIVVSHTPRAISTNPVMWKGSTRPLTRLPAIIVSVIE